MNELIQRFKDYCAAMVYGNFKIVNVHGIQHKYAIQFPSEVESLKSEIQTKLIPGSNAWRQWQFKFDDIFPPQNRVHFTNGIPTQLRGAGLGYKMYKALIMHLGHAESEANATEDAQRVWDKLFKDKELHGYRTDDGKYLIVSQYVSNEAEIYNRWRNFYKLQDAEVHRNAELVNKEA